MNWAQPIAAGVQAGGTMLGNLVNQGSLKAAQNRQNRANMALSEYQFNKELEMWKMQNDYNSPKSQMARFKAAGLNPNLIYGQGNAGNATHIPQYQKPNIEYSAFPVDFGPLAQVLSTWQDMKLKDAQTRAVDTSTALTAIKGAREKIQRDLDRDFARADRFAKFGINHWTHMLKATEFDLRDLELQIAKKTASSVIRKYSSEADSALYQSIVKQYESKFGSGWMGKNAPILQKMKNYDRRNFMNGGRW